MLHRTIEQPWGFIVTTRNGYGSDLISVTPPSPREGEAKKSKESKVSHVQLQKNSKSGCKKARCKSRVKTKKMSDLTSETSASLSSDSKHSKSMAQSSNTAKKSQCDLCKLSYSSEKDLTEHLVSLMHHTKLENKDMNALHECVLCKVECKTMTEYRKHIGLDSHLEKIARLKREHVHDKRPKQTKWGTKAKGWQGHHHSHTNHNSKHASWQRNMNQRGNWNAQLLSQSPRPSHYSNKLSQEIYEQVPGSKTVFSYQNGSQNLHWDYRHKGGYYNDFLSVNTPVWLADGQFNGKVAPRGHAYEHGGQLYEPWGSGLYGHGPRRGERYKQHQRAGHHTYCGEFQNHESLEDDQSGHWDEHSLCMRENFLASMEETNDRQNTLNEDELHHNVQSSHMDVDMDGQWVRSPTKPKAGTKLEGSISSSLEELQSVEGQGLSTSSVDRKRPIKDIACEDVLNSVVPKSFRSFKSPPVQDSSARRVSSQFKTAHSELDSASDDLLQRAEKLCKELREKRMASSQKSGYKVSNKQQETILSQKLEKISQQRQNKYFKGIIKDKQDSSSGDKSCDSGISTEASLKGSKKIDKVFISRGSNKVSRDPGLKQQQSLSDIRKSLEVSVPAQSQRVSKDEEKKSVMSPSYESPKALHHFSSLLASTKESCGSERLQRDSSSYTGNKQVPKAAVKPQIITKDSLKKIINAPKSRDERVHLAKLLHSREDSSHKPASGTSTSRPLQLAGLYDNLGLDLESANAEGDATGSVIRLENLEDSVKEKILSLIGSNCPGIEEIEVSIKGANAEPTTPQTNSEKKSVVSDSEDSMSSKRKHCKESGRKKKSAADSDNMKKKSNQTLTVPYTSPKGSASGDKSAHTETQIAAGAKETKTKEKHSFPQMVIVNLIDSAEEFEFKDSCRSVKDKDFVNSVTCKNKKRKKGTQREEAKDVSFSLDSDVSVSKKFEHPSKTSKTDGFKEPDSLITEFQESKKRQSNFSKERKQESLSTSQCELAKATHSGKSLVSEIQPHTFLKEKSLEKEQSLNSQNVLERFPILMSSSNASVKAKGQGLSLNSKKPTFQHPVSTVCTQSNLSLSIPKNSYAKALATSLSAATQATTSTVSPSQKELVSPESQEAISVVTAHYKLPPSIHLAHRSHETSAKLANEPEYKIIDDNGDNELDNKAGRKTDPEYDRAEAINKEEMSDVVISDNDGPTAMDHKCGEEDCHSTSSSVYSNETSSQAMVELLQLSEREEQIKQEAMNMELRLTRLHRLLEQAVVQINKCTERRTQLLEEEKEISNKRLSLLRGAARGKTSMSSTSSQKTVLSMDSAVTNTEASIERLTQGHLAVAPLQPSHTSTTKAPTLPTLSPSSSMSRADWLAKFASFLPPDPTLEKERQFTSAAYSNVEHNIEGHNQQQYLNLEQYQRPENQISLGQEAPRVESCDDANYHPHTKQTNAKVSNTPAILTSSSAATSFLPSSSSTDSSAVKLLMYMGSFRTPTSNAQSELTNTNPSFGSVSASRQGSECAKGYNDRDKAQNDGVVPLPEPGGNIHHLATAVAGEDSDIGSVASSMASGGSLGEQITHYCRATPGASLDPLSGARPKNAGVSVHHPHDLSVIISSDASLSDHHSGSNLRGREEEEEGHCAGRRGREEDVSDKEQKSGDGRGNYGNLNEDAIRSAEALHVMERNYQEELTSKTHDQDMFTVPTSHPLSKASSVSLSDCGGISKRKKRLTRHEREASQLTRHRKRWLVSSTSSDEEEEQDLHQEAGSVSTGKEKRRDTDSLRTFLSSDKEERGVDKPGKFGVQIVENNVHAGDRNYLFLQMNNGKPTLKATGLVRADETDCVSQLRCEREISALEDRKADVGLRRFEGSNGRVCEMQVVSGHLYVGYENIGISVFDLEGPTEEQISDHAFHHLQCFFVTEVNQALTVIVGNGSFLMVCSASDIKIPPQDMGTPVRCILCSEPDIFLGLDTGEICVINANTFEKRTRFICSDHALRSLALANEGTLKLLCVSAQDGSISVVNSRQGLLLRILTGHTKAAYSLQVDKSSVFSGSADGTVLEQNLNTTRVEHTFGNHKGIVLAVYLYRNYLLTAGTDKLIRCYDTKTHKLIQVNYGAGRGVVTKVIVIDDKLITGNSDGLVDAIDFDISAQNKCPIASCGLNFGHYSHLQLHQHEEQHFSYPESESIDIS
ncbi:Zinc finger protein 106-like [Plakobranchus ocellatus]|uniref:Zinc finger protein 106-like n=1 Tax=Plakobranchus ocellatus TaxID=259542 RepID=A0AAV3ZRC0_9GAST|nr:Zinc finger protein 106-like [Plakobranchus ocellatus]